MSDQSAQYRQLKEVWQNQPMEGVRMSVEQIRVSAAGFRHGVTTRNRREYIAAIVVAPLLGYEFIESSGLVRIGFGLLIAGLLFLARNLYVAGSPGQLPHEAGLRNWIEYRRRELERQRDLLKSVWRWYLGPLIPGLAVLLFAFARANWNTTERSNWMIAVYVIVISALFAFIARINTGEAFRLQVQIDELDRQSGRE